jgi:GntR family transcriptional regulator
MYQQIAEDLQARIESGQLRSGTQLPTELELRDNYRASRNTIRDAIKRLASLGLVQTKPGLGTFVVKKIDPFVTTLSADPSGFGGGDGASFLSEVASRHRSATTSVPKVEVQAPPEEIALRLRITPGTQVVSRHQERFIDGTPWSLQTSFYPMEFVTSGKAPLLLMAQNLEQGVVKYLEQTAGVKQIGYRDWITARTPDQNEQNFFGLAHDATVFEIFRTAFDQGGKPLRVTVTVCPVDRNQFIFNVGVLPEPQYDQLGPETQAT